MPHCTPVASLSGAAIDACFAFRKYLARGMISISPLSLSHRLSRFHYRSELSFLPCPYVVVEG